MNSNVSIFTSIVCLFLIGSPSSAESTAGSSADTATAGDTATGSQNSTPPASHMIYGRIEQLDKSTQPTLPMDLNAETATASVNSGSYPTAFKGSWGGYLQVTSHKVYPSYYELDKKAAERMEELLSALERGAINFKFERQNDNVILKPTYCLFIIHTIPGVHITEGMNVHITQPVEMGFSGGCLAGKGPAGNRFESKMTKDSILKISDTELEEDMVCDTKEWNSSTNQPQQTYSEGVLRFTQTAQDGMKVNVFRLRYDPNGKALWMLTLKGMVYNGVNANDTVPY